MRFIIPYHNAKKCATCARCQTCKVDKMVDNMDEEKVGYWALSDLRNESFVRECLEWTRTQVLHGMSVADIGIWCESAVDILKELVTSMHLTGGGPGTWDGDWGRLRYGTRERDAERFISLHKK